VKTELHGGALVVVAALLVAAAWVAWDIIRRG